MIISAGMPRNHSAPDVFTISIGGAVSSGVELGSVEEDGVTVISGVSLGSGEAVSVSPPPVLPLVIPELLPPVLFPVLLFPAVLVPEVLELVPE